MEYCSHESYETISKPSPQFHLLTKQKNTTTTFWNRFAHDKLARTGQINQILPYLHYTPRKNLASVCLHAFPQLSTSALLTKSDLATNSWWQLWQRCCLSRKQANCFHQMCNQIFPSIPFKVQLFSLEMLLAACFLGWYPLHTYPCPTVYQEVVT